MKQTKLDVVLQQYHNAGIPIKNEKDIEKIIELKKLHQYKKDLSKYFIGDCIPNYEAIIRKTAELFAELDITNTIEVCNMFSYMLYSGLFSRNHKYTYKPNSKKSTVAQYDYGMTIMDQTGVCLNTVFLLDDVLKELGEYGEMMTVWTMGGTLNYKTPVPRGNSENIFDRIGEFIQYKIQKSSKIEANHICEIIEYNDDYYMYDPTCMCIYSLDGTFESSVLNGTKKVSIRPYNALIMNDEENISEVLRHYKGIITSCKSDEDRAKIEKITLQLFKKSLQMFNSNKNLIEDFHADIRQNIDRVSEFLNRRRNFLEYVEVAPILYYQYYNPQEVPFYHDSILETTATPKEPPKIKVY